MTYFETVKPTFLENWPKGMMNLSFSSVPTKLSLKEARALGAEIVEWGETFGPRGMLAVDGIKDRLGKAMAFFPNGAFVRLGSRSPKVSWNGHREGFKCRTAADAIALLTDCSERMHGDLQLALHEKYQPTIWLREWHDDLGYEIRCFVKGRRLVAASQYEYKCIADDLYEHRRSIIEAIVRYVEQDFLPVCHLEDVIVDLAVRRKVHDKHGVVLIEINPYFEHTDPCLFDWKTPRHIEAGWFRCIEPIDSCVATEPLAPPKKFTTGLGVGG